MDITVQKESHYVVVKAAGRLDTNTAPEFEQECAACLTGSEGKIILDFSKLEYISSAGLRCVLSMAKKIRANGGNLVLCGLSGFVEEVIRISGFDSFLTIFTDVARAVDEN